MGQNVIIWKNVKEIQIFNSSKPKTYFSICKNLIITNIFMIFKNFKNINSFVNYRKI